MTTRDEAIAAAHFAIYGDNEYHGYRCPACKIIDALAPWLPDEDGVSPWMERVAEGDYDAIRGASVYRSNVPLYRMKPSAASPTKGTR
jgi:hypothetical protein